MVWALGVQTRCVGVGALKQVHSTHCVLNSSPTVLYPGLACRLSWVCSGWGMLAVGTTSKAVYSLWELALRPKLGYRARLGTLNLAALHALLQSNER